MSEERLVELLAGLEHVLPPRETPRTIEEVLDAVADMALRLDAHEDASTPAFDEIAKLCGCPEWEYPGQVVRDVEAVVRERDTLSERASKWVNEYESIIDGLSQKLRIAEAVRDDARAASQRYLDEKRSSEAANGHYAALLAAQEKRINEKELETYDLVRDGLDIVKASNAFVLAHCELEQLANEIGADAASKSPLNDRVIGLHMELERAVLGTKSVPGRRL